MIDILSKKEKIILSLISLGVIGGIITKGIMDVKNYKILKNLNKKLLKYSWEYYE